MNKNLHEKKIGWFRMQVIDGKVMCQPKEMPEYIVNYDRLKQWAISVVKECGTQLETFALPFKSGDVFEVICGDDITGKGEYIFCDACRRFINRFEITPQELDNTENEQKSGVKEELK